MNTQVSVYPNPFTSSLSLEVAVESDASAIVRLIDENDKIIKMISWGLKKGSNKTSFHNLQSMPPGNYFVDIKDMDARTLFSTKIIKV